MINLHQLFRAFSRVSAPQDSCYSTATSATRNRSPFVADAAATFPAAPAPVSAAPLAAGISASSAPRAAGTGAPAAGTATSPLPVPATDYSLPVAAALAEVAAASCSPSPAAEREGRGTEATKKKRSGTWQQESYCSKNLPCFPSDTPSRPDIVSSLPLSSPCSTASAGMAAVAAAAGVESASHECLEVGGVLAGRDSSGSPGDISKAEETGVRETQQQEECCPTRDTTTGTTTGAILKCFSESVYDAAGAPAAAALSLSSGELSRPIPAAGSQPASVNTTVSSTVATVAVPFTSQGSVASPSTLIGLIGRFNGSSTTSASGSLARSSATKNEISGEKSALGVEETSGSRSTSCSRSTSSSNSPTTSSSNSPTTSCLGAALDSSCSAGRDSHSFSLSFSPAAGGPAAATADEEVMRPPLPQRQQQTAASAREPIGIDQQQQTAAAEGEEASRVFESTTATLLHLKPRQEELRASAVLAAALAAVEAAKLQRAVESEKTRQRQQQQGAGCRYGEDSSGDSTAEASPACADFSSLLTKHSSRSSDEEELLVKSPGSCFSPATAAPAPVPAATGAGATAGAAAPPSASSSPGGISAWKAGVAAASHTTAVAGGAAIAAFAPGPISTVKGDKNTAAAGVTAAATTRNDFAAASATPGETLFSSQQCPPSATAFRTLGEVAALARAEPTSSAAGGEAGGCAICAGLDYESSEATSSSGSSRTGSYSGVSSCSSDDEKLKTNTPHQQQIQGAAAGKTEVGLLAHPAKAVEREPLEVAADAAAGTVTAVTTATAVGREEASNSVDSARKEKERTAARDAEHGTAAAERSVIENKKTRHESSPSRKLRDGHAAVVAAAAAVVTTVGSRGAATGSSLPAGTCVGSPAAAKAPGVENSSCFEKRESSSSNSCSVTSTTDRSRSNTSTSSDDCSGTDRCFSASLSAGAGSPHPLSAAATTAGHGEEGAFTNMQLQQQQVAEESARLLSTAFPVAATDACSIAEKLKLLSPLTHSGSPAQGFPVGLDHTASAVFPSATPDASAAAAVATWFSSLLPQQQQQLCAAASAAFLPGLLLQPKIPCSSPNPPLISSVSASGAPVTCPSSEKLSTTFVASAATKEKPASSAPAARTTESPCAFCPEKRNSAAPAPAVGGALSETADAAAAAAAQPAAAKNAAQAAATRKQGNPEVSVAQEETAPTAPALKKQQLSILESQQQQHQITSPREQHISSVLRQQLQAPHASVAGGSRAAHIAGVNGSSACLFTIESGRKFLPAAAGVSPASFASASSCSSSSSCAPPAPSPPPLPPTAVACILPGEVLSSSLLLSSAAAAPFHSPLSILSSLPSTAPAGSRSPVVAAVTRSLDAAACNTLFTLPAPSIPTAANTGLLLPATATVAARGLHADGVATELPTTPVLAAAAGAMLPAASGTSSCMTSPSTAATPTLSSFHPLSSFRSAAATSPMRLEQLETTPATAGQQQLQQSGKDSLLAAGSSPYSSLSSSAAPLSSFPSSSASPSFANLAVPASQVGPRGSRLLPALATKATQSLLQSDASCTSTAALINKKHSPYEPKSPPQRTEPSSTPAAGTAISLSAAPVSSTTATDCTLASAAATLATTAAAGTSSAGEKQSVFPAAPPFSPSTVSASAFSTPSPTPLGGPVASLLCSSNSTGSQPTTPLLSQGTSAAASVTGAGVAAPALQLQQADPLQRSSSAAGGVEPTSIGGAAEIPTGTSQPVTGAAEIPTGASQPVTGAAGTSLAAAVASPASTSALDTTVSASPYGGVVDSDAWGTTAQQLLLQLNMQQLRRHGQQQHAQIALDSTHFSSSTFLPPLCISPLAAAAAVVADSSARPFSLARVHQQQVGAAAAARTAALVQEAEVPGSAAVALREAGAATASAANTSAAAHSSNLSGLLAVAAAMKKVNSTPLPPFTSLQASADTCQRQQQQQLQNCGSAEAEGGEGKCVESDNKGTKQAGENKSKKSSFSQLKWAHEQQLQQSDKQPTAKSQQQMQMQSTKQQTTTGEGGRIPGVDGPPVKRARRGGGAAASTVDSVALGFPNSSNNDCQLATSTTTTAPARLPPLLKNSVEAAALKRVGATAVAGRGPGLVFNSPAAATSLAGVQQQLLAQLQQNQLLLQSGATNGGKSVFDSRLATECAPLSEPAGVAAPAATATAACVGASVAMQQGFRYFVECLSSPSAGALATAGAATGETGVTALTAGTSSGPILSALAASRLSGPSVAATSFACRLPSPALLPPPDIREKASNTKDSAAAAAALHFQTLQQLHRLGLHPQQQQQEAVNAACTLDAVGCPAGVTAANLPGKSSFPVTLTLPQQQRLSLSCSSSVLRATAAAAGAKVLPNEGPTTTAVSSSETGAAAAGKDGRTTGTTPAAGGTGLRGGPRQQKRTPRQDQQQRQQQRQATSLHRQEQNVSLHGMHQHHPGVCYSPPKDVWRARITVEGRQHEQQFSVKRHGFEEARLLAVQWRSQMERLRLGGADGGGGVGAPEGSGVEAAPAVAGSGAKVKGAAGMNKAGSGTGNSLINSSSSSSGSTTLPVSSGSSSGGSNVVQYLVCSSSSSGSSPGKTGLPCSASGQQDIAKSVTVSAAQQAQQQDFVTPLTTCCSEATYRDFTSISQLAGLCNNGCRPVSSPSTKAADTSVSLLSGDPLSQMRTLALSARHLMHAKGVCATQHQSTGTRAEDSNIAACNTAILFPPSLLSLLDAAAGGGGRAAAAPSAGGPLGIGAPSVPAGDTAPPESHAAVPALAARSRPAATPAARGCS